MRRTTLRLPRPHKARAFISYAHEDRRYGRDAKTILALSGFDAFLAHEDVELSAEWRDRLVEELARCELFVPLLSEGFIASRWASQEIGFVVARPNVAIAPLSIDGTTPYGLISHLQSRPVPKTGITDDVLIAPLARKLPRQILPFMIYRAAEAGEYRWAESRMEQLVPLFSLFTPGEAQMLAQGAVENGQIWNAQMCREEYLPEFLRVQSENIELATRQALHYQIEHGEWYHQSEQEVPAKQ